MDKLNKDILNVIYEGRLDHIDEITADLLYKIDMYTSFADMKYEDRLRDMELINTINKYNDGIVDIIKKIDIIEIDAINNENGELVMKCEGRKANLINVMIALECKYL